MLNADLRGALHVAAQSTAAVWQPGRTLHSTAAQETKLSRVRRVRAGTTTLTSTGLRSILLRGATVQYRFKFTTQLGRKREGT